MLMPKRTKHRKQHRGRMRGEARGGFEIEAVSKLILVNTACRHLNQPGLPRDKLKPRGVRRAMTRYMKRRGQVWIRIFPDKPVTKRAAETRMGSGKGSVEYWVAVVKPGRMMFEIAGVDEVTAREALRLAMYKLPIKTQFRSKYEYGAAESSAPAVTEE